MVFLSRFLIALVLCLGVTHSIFASTAFQNLTTTDLENITKDLGANFSHRSVTGAASMGAAFGFEATLVAGSTASPEINRISLNSGGGAVENLASVGALLGVSVPFGVTFEYLLTPSFNASGSTFAANSYGIRWLMNDLIPILPVNLALRLNQSSVDLSFEQDVNSVTGKVESKTGVTEISVYLAPKLPVIEPYVGVGMVTGKGNLSYTGTSTIFDTQLTVGNQAEASVSSTKMVAGVSIWAPLFSFGVEYVNLFSTSGYSLKLGFSF